MAKRNVIPVPLDIKQRYRADEQVKHELMQSEADICLWKSTLNRDALAKPEQVRYHLTEAGSAFALLIADKESASHWFKAAVERHAKREHYFQVVHDVKEANGRRILGMPLSRKIPFVGTLRRVLRRTLRTNSEAYCMECRVYC
jgi:hypothetical protein